MTEAKIFFYALSMLILCLEGVLMWKKIPLELPRSFFVTSCMVFFFCFTVLEYIFRMFIDKKISCLLAVLPGVLLGILFFRTGQLVLLSYAVFAAVLLRTVFCFLPKKEYLFLYGCFVFDGIAVYLRFLRGAFLGDYSTDRLLFLCLVVLTLSSLQHLICQKKPAPFPFHFFLLLALLLFFMPVKKTPIDWTGAKKIYQQAAETVSDTLYSVNGIFKGNTYSSGYSSFSVTGGKLEKNSTKQLILRTGDYPYYTYKDKDTGINKLVKKSLYLPGRTGADKESLIEFIQLLYNHKIDKETAALFSRITSMEVEYEYLTTADLIIPSNTFAVTDPLGKPLNSSDETYKKGFRMEVSYLDIDYGSPYLTSLYPDSKSNETFSYETACAYAQELYGMDLSSVLTKEEFNEIISGTGLLEETLDTTGATEEMRVLAKDITKNATTDYEKCQAIESYLRQFPYSTDAVGGYNKNSTMATTEGMADIANRFLFETKEGYCIHYTASMVMLLRLNDIPARAVMGYRYDFPTAMQKEYTVTSDSAHAWPTAYIEGAGWIPFEPTGVYSDALSRSWRRNAKGDEINVPAENATVAESDAVTAESITKDKAATRMKLLKIAVPVLASITVLLLIVILGRILGRKIIYRFASPEKRLKMDVEDIKRDLLKHTDKEFHDRGLLYDYLDIAPEEQKIDIKQTFDLYYKSVYEK